jgi:maltooligosyltrehalose trehalohydrolase
VNEKVDAFSIQKGRRFYMIAESDLNDTKVITPREKGGFGFDTQWMDDFHHALHALLTKETTGYYSDFGNIESLAKSIQDGFVHDGYYSEHRKRKFGNSSAGISGEHFVVCTQNHDQVGNRMLGERLSKLVSFEALKVAAATMLVSPYVPMLFMGEEYAEENPFLYFVSHTDPGLVEAVRKGRRAEFAAFSWLGEAPDPQAEATFQQSKLEWNKRNEGKHAQMHQWYKQLIHLRKEHSALHNPDKKCLQVDIIQDKIQAIQRWQTQNNLLCLINYSDQAATFRLEGYQGSWHKLLDGADTAWGGNGKSLPQTIQERDEITMSAFGVAIYKI